jgi:hypothetical protein
MAHVADIVPLPQQAVLSDDFDFSLGRKAQCPKPEEIDEFTSKNPLWGMPFGLPGLSDADYNTLERWLEQAANPFVTFSVIPADSRWRFLMAAGQKTAPVLVGTV